MRQKAQLKEQDFDELVGGISSQMRKFGDFFFFEARYQFSKEQDSARKK